MKKVIAMIAILGFAGSIANAQVGNFKYDGKFEFHKFANNNTTDADDDAGDKVNDQHHRANIGISFDAGQDAKVQVNLIKTPGANNVEFGQAYAALDNVLYVNHKFGRMFYGEQGDMVAYFGPDFWYGIDPVTDNGMLYNAFEGWYGEWKKDKLTLAALIGKKADTYGDVDGDEDLVGVTANYPVNDYLNPTAYVYMQKTDNPAGTPNDKLNVMGVKATGKIADLNLNYYGEFAMNSGEQNATEDYAGNALRLGATMDVELAGKWAFNAEIARGSGDDDGTDDENNDFTAISSNYRPGIVYGGFNAGLDNLTVINVGAMYTPAKIEKLTLGAKFFNLTPTEEPAAYDAIGNELDLCANWQHTENVSLKGYYAMFMADKDYMDIVNDATNDDDGTDDAAYQFGVLVNVKF